MFRIASWAVPAVAAVLLTAGPAAAETEEGKARKVPWSGYWWPAKQGAMISGPLTKYDAFVGSGSTAASWERGKYKGQAVADWWGYCHAWSAACVSETEPRTPVYATTAGGQRMPLGVGDQKGLLTIIHGNDPSNFYGTRFNGSNDYSDISPDLLWKVLKLYVKQQGIPLILDVDAGTPVWNYPVFMYRVDYRNTGGESYQAMMTLWFADDAVPPDYLGIKVMKRQYQFTFKMRGGAVVAGSGKWIGTSVRDHPDFAWYPQRTQPENPRVDRSTVMRMLNRGNGRDPVLPNPDPNVNFIPDPNNPPTQPVTPPVNPPVNPPVTPPGGTDPVNIVPDPVTPPPALPNEKDPKAPSVLSPTEFLTMIAHRQNKKANFTFDVKVGSKDGLINPIVAPGDQIYIQGSAQKPGYLYLFHIEPNGDFSLAFPLPNQNNVVGGDKAFTIGKGMRAELVAEGPVGTHRMLAIITTRPLKFSNAVVMQKQDQAPTAPPKQKVEFYMNPTTKEVMKDMIRDMSRGDSDPAKLTPGKVQVETGVDVEKLDFEFSMAEAIYVVQDKAKAKQNQERKP
jgi:hypothetical protein